MTSRRKHSNLTDYQRESFADRPSWQLDAAERIYAAYPAECLPKGMCDPAYMMAVVQSAIDGAEGRKR